MKKGFTIIEIVISIGLITVVGIVSFISFNAIKTHNKNKTLENMSDTILTAVNLYVETNTDVKKELYQNKNGLKIPLTTLKTSGLVDFKDIELTEKDYVVTMLGTTNPNGDGCAETYTAKSWNIKDDEYIYICEKADHTNEILQLQQEINALKDQLNKTLIKKPDYIAQGENPNNWVIFDVVTRASEWAYWPNTTDSNGIKEQDLWRILSIKDGVIKLIYNQLVQTNCSFVKNEYSNYFLEKTTKENILNNESKRTYTLKENISYQNNCATRNYYYFSCNNLKGWTYGDMIEPETNNNSKKYYLLNSIAEKYKKYISEEDYYYNYDLSHEEERIVFSPTVQSKIGTLNQLEIEQTYYNMKSFLNNLKIGSNVLLLGSRGGSSKLVGYESHPYLATYEGCYTISEVYHQDNGLSHGWVNGKNNHMGINTYSFVPVITLKKEVSIVKNTNSNCQDSNMGTKGCPYKLECSNC